MAYQIVAVNDAAPGACSDVGMTWNGSTTLTATQIIAGTSMTMSGTAAVTGPATFGGTVGITGTTTCAAIDASGAGDFAGDFSVATNKMTVAAATGNTTVAGTLVVSGSATFSGATDLGALALGATSYGATSGAVVVTVNQNYSGYTTNSSADIAATLADGLDGQIKTIKLETKDTNNLVVTPANLSGSDTTITFDASGEIAFLVFDSNAWTVIYTTATVA